MTMAREAKLAALKDVLSTCSFFRTSEAERWRQAERLLSASSCGRVIVDSMDLNGSPAIALHKFIETLQRRLDDADLQSVIDQLRAMIESGRDDLAREINDLECQMADLGAQDETLYRALKHDLFISVSS